MGDHSAIQWTDATWNPVAGCTRVSAGCDHCYAARLVATRMKHSRQYRGLATITRGGRAAFNGRIRLLPERLDQPLRWRRPRRVFVNSMSDLFHERIPDDFLAKVFHTMSCAQRHQFQVLTKRPKRMRDFLIKCGRGPDGWVSHNGDWLKSFGGSGLLVSNADDWPLPNVWLGVSCEDQRTADERIPLLLGTPAAVRFISAEPLLGPIQLSQAWRDYLAGWGTEPVHVCGGDDPERCSRRCPEAQQYQTEHLDWVIVGGESGPGHRPMHEEWARSIRDQCVAAGVPFFFKQWGGPTPKTGGRVLDGRIWDFMPSAAAPALGPSA